MAVSAFFISWLSSLPSCGLRAMPILAVTKNSRFSSTNGRTRLPRMFSATWMARFRAISRVGRGCSSRVNSSPPMRATVSSSSTQASRRRAMSLSMRSPAAWPRESLIGLKRSRSRNISTTQAFCRSACCRALYKRSWNSVRLGRWVRAS
ncbi:hypothetical protein D3C75_687570 [compost metagenome]